MSTERTLEKRKSMAEVAREIDKISSSAVQQFEDAGDFEKELVVATAVVDMRALLTPEIMAPVMALMNTDLGFRTDRDPKQNDKAGRPLVPYSMDVVRDVFIESRLRGFHAVGNEFNIIAGRFYGCKNGFERKVRELTKGTCEVSIDVPQMMGGTAKVKCRATWAINGQKGDIGVRPEDPCEFLVRINEFMGPDGAIGKAQRKLYQRIYSRLTGKSVPDGDAAEGSIEVSASVTRQPGGAKHHEFEPAEPAKNGADEKPAQPAQEAPKPGETPKQPDLVSQVNTPQQDLAVHMESNGVTFDKFIRWASETERLENADSFPSWADLPTEFVEALAKDTKSMGKCVIRCKTY